ncbi:MAG: GIY-YIG nuclease family protein [Acidobacteria bacterium]|nr:GIY-YIG nuclease family protein [Acidobacteriota bacterium]
MNLNDLLAKHGLDTKQRKHILVMRHRAHQPELHKVLPWLAAEKPVWFNAYQQSQWPKQEKMLTQAKYLASFIGHEPGEALFVGVYKVGRSRSVSFDEFWRIPANREVSKLGMTGLTKDGPSCLWFDLRLTEIYQDWKGKLIINWPPPERAWCRWADRNEFPVKAILQESLLVRETPASEELTLSWEELRNLPSSWKSALAQWRGVYLILDRSDGKSYVGSAYGRDNIHSRWSNYAARGHGGNKQLRGRKPENFLFSILERVSPDMVPEEVIQKESNWKKRLHTREFGLNDN